MHHRVQMRPVAVRARFWVTESFSTGRAKSEMPAMTRDHCDRGLVPTQPLGGTSSIDSYVRTFMTGALRKVVSTPFVKTRDGDPIGARDDDAGAYRETHQKCTVFRPMGLSHMRLNQDCCACSPAAELCHLLPPRAPPRTPDAPCWPARALHAEDSGWLRKRGREALRKLLVADIFI